MTGSHDLDRLRVLLTNYEPWANRRCVEMLVATPAASDRAGRILAHTVAAAQIWLSRIGERPFPLAEVWPELSLDRCREEIEATRHHFEQFFARLEPDELQRVVAYTNSKGESFETPLGEILTHLCVHGGYHRGQIASAVREAGGTPANTDYIVFSRGR